MTEEKLTLSSTTLQVEVWPRFGAKIGSLRTVSDGEELLQQPLRPYAPGTHTMAFDEGDASGIDECIPTVSGCEIAQSGKKLDVPDHGDFWRIPFRHRREENEWIFEADGFTLPLRFEKRLKLEGDTLSIDYCLENIGNQELPFVWSAHPGFAVETDDRILLPESVQEISAWYSGNSRLGEPGRVHSWPQTVGANGAPVDLSVAGSFDDGVGDKIFLKAPEEGWIALDRRRIKRRIEVRFDPLQAPHVGLWLAYGGWPEGQARRQHCVALEPCTAPVDSLAVAIEQGYARRLAPAAQTKWRIEIHVVPA